MGPKRRVPMAGGSGVLCEPGSHRDPRATQEPPCRKLSRDTEASGSGPPLAEWRNCQDVASSAKRYNQGCWSEHAQKYRTRRWCQSIRRLKNCPPNHFSAFESDVSGPRDFGRISMGFVTVNQRFSTGVPEDSLKHAV